MPGTTTLLGPMAPEVAETPLRPDGPAAVRSKYCESVEVSMTPFWSTICLTRLSLALATGIHALLLVAPSVSVVDVTELKTPLPAVPPSVDPHEPIDDQFAAVGLLGLTVTVTR